MVDERALRLLAGGVGRAVGEWRGRTERAVAGGEHVSTGESEEGRNARTVFSCLCRGGLAASYEEDKRLPPS